MSAKVRATKPQQKAQMTANMTIAPAITNLEVSSATQMVELVDTTNCSVCPLGQFNAVVVGGAAVVEQNPE